VCAHESRKGSVAVPHQSLRLPSGHLRCWGKVRLAAVPRCAKVRAEVAAPRAVPAQAPPGGCLGKLSGGGGPASRLTTSQKPFRKIPLHPLRSPPASAERADKQTPGRYSFEPDALKEIHKRSFAYHVLLEIRDVRVPGHHGPEPCLAALDLQRYVINNQKPPSHFCPPNPAAGRQRGRGLVNGVFLTQKQGRCAPTRATTRRSCQDPLGQLSHRRPLTSAGRGVLFGSRSRVQPVFQGSNNGITELGFR